MAPYPSVLRGSDPYLQHIQHQLAGAFGGAGGGQHNNYFVLPALLVPSPPVHRFGNFCSRCMFSAPDRKNSKCACPRM
jgi:hypothetical protein